MVSFIYLSLVFLVLHATADPNDGLYYNCSKVVQGTYGTVQAACTAVPYCLWSTVSSQCSYDKCIKYVADDGGNPCPDQEGVECELFYITDIHDCDSGDPIQTDRYCRSNSSAIQKGPAFDKCFYDDLKNREVNAGAVSCGKKWCNLTNNSSLGSYCSQIGAPEDSDCSTYFNYNDIPGLCECLGTAHCDLYPDCMVNSSACIQDPCSLGTATTDKGTCLNIGGAQNCVGKRRQVASPSNTILDTIVCSSSANNKANECFFAYNYTSVPSTKYPDYPECTVQQQNEDICGKAYTFKSDGSNDPDKKCALEPIASGYFPFAKYCNDGERTVPSPDRASVLRVSSFVLAAMLSVIYFL